MNALCGISSELVYGKLPHSLPRILSLSTFPKFVKCIKLFMGSMRVDP